MDKPRRKYRLVSAFVRYTGAVEYNVYKRAWFFWRPMNVISMPLEAAQAAIAELEKNDP